MIRSAEQTAAQRDFNYQNRQHNHVFFVETGKPA
jgi:hypothetical protein